MSPAAALSTRAAVVLALVVIAATTAPRRVWRAHLHRIDSERRTR